MVNENEINEHTSNPLPPEPDEPDIDKATLRRTDLEAQLRSVNDQRQAIIDDLAGGEPSTEAQEELDGLQREALGILEDLFGSSESG